MQPIHDLRVGEIFVGGEGLTRGYWNRPELTAEKFLQLEIEPQVFERLYRTGDLGRFNAAGLLEFVGRTDFQVKIRGYRIEPEEIELALCSMPGLAAAAVIATGISPETKQLCCYYVQDMTKNITAEAIKSFLSLQFPDYMVPTVLRELASLPRNTNDKVDRKALEKSVVIPRMVRPPDVPLDPGKEISSEIFSPALVQKMGVLDEPVNSGGNPLLSAGLFAMVQNAIRKVTSAFPQA
jgi:acyl-CoA synthetase (AMP-forming)/AMP-acid ligase II